MTQRELLRDRIAGDLDPDLVRERQSAGWRLVAVEWERDTREPSRDARMEVPYGMRISLDCHHLEEDPEEGAVLRTIMRMVVQDRPLSKIADELNSAGRRTRAGNPWTVADVFRLMPVLVDSGPRMFAHPDWAPARTV
jgi:hypothetical protein